MIEIIHECMQEAGFTPEQIKAEFEHTKRTMPHLSANAEMELPKEREAEFRDFMRAHFVLQKAVPGFLQFAYERSKAMEQEFNKLN